RQAVAQGCRRAEDAEHTCQPTWPARAPEDCSFPCTTTATASQGEYNEERQRRSCPIRSARRLVSFPAGRAPAKRRTRPIPLVVEEVMRKTLLALPLLALAAALVGLPPAESACCYFAAKDKDILQPAQKAFITWDGKGKVETFTVQPKFEGNARDFGMVI